MCSHLDRKAGTQPCAAMSTEPSYEDGLKAWNKTGKYISFHPVWVSYLQHVKATPNKFLHTGTRLLCRSRLLWMRLRCVARRQWSCLVLLLARRQSCSKNERRNWFQRRAINFKPFNPYGLQSQHKTCSFEFYWRIHWRRKRSPRMQNCHGHLLHLQWTRVVLTNLWWWTWWDDWMQLLRKVPCSESNLSLLISYVVYLYPLPAPQVRQMMGLLHLFQRDLHLHQKFQIHTQGILNDGSQGLGFKREVRRAGFRHCLRFLFPLRLLST